MAWASGQVVGGVAGGGLASVTGNAAPSLAIAALLLFTVAYALPSPGHGFRRGRRRRLGSRPMSAGKAATISGEWRNWAGDQACRPVELVQPRNRDELAEAVGSGRCGWAQGERRRLGPLVHRGGDDRRHDGQIEALSGVVDADPATGLVRVGGGTVLADLNEELHRLGLAMENLGDIDRQTIAGAISTGTHGTGAKLRNISSQVEALELVLADGSVRELGAERRGAAAGGAGRGRRARRDLRRDAALRPRLHPAPGRHAAPA